MVALRFYQRLVSQQVNPVKKEVVKTDLPRTISTRLLDLKVPDESVLLLELGHLVAELVVDRPDGGVQLLHARSVRLVLS